jgi:hypothetical protein
VPAHGHRDPYKEQHWREIIARQKLSGLSKAQFCLNEGIKPSAFSNWERTIRARDEENRRADGKSKQQHRNLKRTGASSKAKFASAQNVSKQKPTFVRATVSAPREISSPLATIEISVPSGVVVRVPASFDLKMLVRIMDALR